MATASLSTHVLDTGAGRPAAGVEVRLTAGGELVASA
jgi:5-hydroxyisourate hydrolase-like protein (transthyretin family)